MKQILEILLREEIFEWCFVSDSYFRILRLISGNIRSFLSFAILAKFCEISNTYILKKKGEDVFSFVLDGNDVNLDPINR